MSDYATHPAGDFMEKKDAAGETTAGLRALLVSGDLQTIDTLCHFMGQMAMHVEVCSDFGLAGSKLAHSKFEALVVDFKQPDDALGLLKTTRQQSSYKYAVILGVLNSNAQMPEAFRAGANFVLVRPLSSQVLTRTLRVSYPLMVHEKRRYFRCPMQIPVNLWKDSDPEIVAACSNLSEAGIGLTNTSGLKVGDKLTLRLTLPETDASLKIDAQVCWRDDAGAAGLQFLDVPMPVKERLAGWLADKLEQYLQGEAALKR